MKFIVINLTNDHLVCSPIAGKGDIEFTGLPPSASASLVVSKKLHARNDRVVITRDDEGRKTTCVVKLDRRKLKLRVKWNLLYNASPWMIYRYRDDTQKLIILPKRDLTSFMSELPDSLPLSAVMLPGTHQTNALYGWPVSQCQARETPISAQLKAGIRVLDVRLAVIKSKLMAYHGAVSQNYSFQEMLSAIYEFFLTPGCSGETIIMSIKQEDAGSVSQKLFSSLVKDEIFSGPGGADMWFFENRVPKLREVRGKVILLSRFGKRGDGWDQQQMGLHPIHWPNNRKIGFAWTNNDTLIKTHDWYAIPSFVDIPEKVTFAVENMLQKDKSPTLAISFFSASNFPFALPSTCACGFGWPEWGFGVEGINSRLVRWLLDQLSSSARSIDDIENENNSGTEEKGPIVKRSFIEPRIRGWALLDFYAEPYDSGLLPLLVECNYRGRQSGEEGWP